MKAGIFLTINRNCGIKGYRLKVPCFLEKKIYIYIHNNYKCRKKIEKKREDPNSNLPNRF